MLQVQAVLEEFYVNADIQDVATTLEVCGIVVCLRLYGLNALDSKLHSLCTDFHCSSARQQLGKLDLVLQASVCVCGTSHA